MSERSSTNIFKSAIQKIKKIHETKWGETVISVLLSALALLFTVIFYSVRFTDYYHKAVSRGSLSFWSAKIVYFLFNDDINYISNFNVYFTTAFIVGIILNIAVALLLLIKKDVRGYYAAAAYNLILCLIGVILGVAIGILRSGAIACAVISMVISMALFAYAMFRRRAFTEKNKRSSDATVNTYEYNAPPPISPAAHKKIKIAALICECATVLIMIISFFVPLYTLESGAETVRYRAIDSLGSGGNIYTSIVFIVMILAFFAELLSFLTSVTYFFKSDKDFTLQTHRSVKGITVFTLLFFIVGYSLAFFYNIKNSESIDVTHAESLSYIPLIFAAIIFAVHSALYGKLLYADGAAEAQKRKPLRVEPLIGVLLITAVTFVSLFLNIADIHCKVGEEFVNDVKINGYQLLTAYESLEGGFQTLAFIEFACLLMSGVLIALSVIGFFTRDKNYYKIIKISAIANFLFVLIIGLFGIYFKIAQKINMENLNSLLEYYEIDAENAYVYQVSSQTIYMVIADFIIVAVMMFRGIFGIDRERDGASRTKENDPSVLSSRASEHVDSPCDFDACPAFTELDKKQELFRAELDERRLRLFADPSLNNVVRFVVNYARESRLHLSYSAEEIATFVAGLGASRLAILQGMSGTGKTSLPKIFAEAIYGNCEIVEVESSWRDKNELLGYYNEFSKCYTPKKFTQCLYKARLNPSVLTLIVLDEMNLSRIEYYFSDFLSLMENEEDKREIKLLNIKLFRYEDGREIPYAGLSDGHTVKIPPNVWFIGTANRDESTFAISDKVYDRAQTMNFNKRAPKIHSFGEPLEQKFVPYDMLLKLFDDARSNGKFDAENNVTIQKTEKLLAPYNISFGNRVLKQMEDFVNIYCACFDGNAAAEAEAVEKILLSKVVSKLENKIVENKEALASEFDKLGLKTCATFVRKLNED